MTTRMRMTIVTCASLMLFVYASPVPGGQAPLLTEDFESYKSGTSVLDSKRWSGFEGFRGKAKPSASIVEGKGIDRSKALAISSADAFRTDNWGIRAPLDKPVSEGVVWIQCRFHPPAEWKGGLFFDLRGSSGRAILARIAGAPYQAKGEKTKQLRWHSIHNVAYWRLYTKTKLLQKWHTLTARIDFNEGTYAGWVDEQTLGEDLPLASKAPFSHVYVGVAGSPVSPALIDNLVVSREAPKGHTMPTLLPKSEKDLIFRFAAIGDPQLGFGGFETDKARFAHAVRQINRSGAEHSFMLGDMVHVKTDIKAYEAMVKLVKGFKKPYHYVRGNHELPELFTRYFFRRLHYSLIHKGVRFVIVDAEGNHVGMSDRQLDWIESEFEKATKANEEIVIALHVSPWQKNERGRGKYNQIGKGRDRLRALMKKHKVLLSLSGHYHRGLWHAKEVETHYLVLGGTALVKLGTYAWCSFDVYPDRIVVHQKPLFFAC